MAYLIYSLEETGIKPTKAGTKSIFYNIFLLDKGESLRIRRKHERALPRRFSPLSKGHVSFEKFTFQTHNLIAPTWSVSRALSDLEVLKFCLYVDNIWASLYASIVLRITMEMTDDD